ncbi:unnamed protein product, partial [Ectocarpus fasciculatus]
MKYLARITTMNRSNSDGSSVGQLEQRVLNTNPILEAFGNAKTLRNDNSSRFGKFIKIQFDNSGRICGAVIEKYLLEKTRLVHQLNGERNFHILYQLIKGLAASNTGAEYSISGDPEDYLYLSQTEVTELPNVSDADEFKTTTACLQSVGIDEATQHHLFRLLAGVLHLGNVSYKTGGEDGEENVVTGVTESSNSHHLAAASLFEIESADFLTAISKRNMHVSDSVIVKTQKLEEAVDKRDSFSKSIYSMIFNWLVDRINQTITSPVKATVKGIIGVLDIYGFENFENCNGFEQLLINYANEKLQNHFNKHVFAIEQTEYESEGIDWSYITFNDNQPCVDLIEGRPGGKAGIFQTLDDSFAGGRGDVNAAFLTQLNLSWGAGKHLNYVTPRFHMNESFGISHYAGDVFYEIAGFNEKNRDSMNPDMKAILSTSKNPLLAEMAADAMRQESAPAATGTGRRQSVGGGGAARRGSVSKLKEDSIGKQFTASLKQLYDVLDATEPHFVRCVKPNDAKVPDVLDACKVLLQLRNAGMMETIRIRQQGFALRQLHEAFFHRYHPLAPECETLSDLVKVLSKSLSVSNESWQVGATKIFLKRRMSDKLERLLLLRITSSARKIQFFWSLVRRKKCATKIQASIRTFLVRMRFRKVHYAGLLIQTAYRRIRCRIKYIHNREAAICAQMFIRRFLAQKIVQAMRNPLNKLSYAELEKEIENKSTELQQYFEKKDYARCEQINRKKSKLLQYMESFPSASDITAKLDAANQELRLAVGKKNFRACGELQTKVDQLENELKTLQVCSDGPILSVEELKSMRADLDKSLSVAFAAKEFNKCAEIQTEIDRISEQIDRKDMSCEQATAKIEQIEADISTAKRNGQFHVAAQLIVESEFYLVELRTIALSLDKTVTETVKPELSTQNDKEEKPKRSRADVLSEYQKKQDELNAAIAAKNFKICEVLQSEVDALKADLDSMPTASDLALKISSMEIEIADAIKERKFRKCDELETALSTLRVDYQIVAEAERKEKEEARRNKPETAPPTPIKVSVTNKPSRFSFMSPKRGIMNPTLKTGMKKVPKNTDQNQRPVSKLRPRKPVTLADTSTCFEVAQAMASNRADAALLVGADGSLSGILTDNDVTRRIVAHELSAESLSVSDVMTKGPKCVCMDDSALDALEMMVDNRFRHLPVLDASGAVVGLLDIAKCLYDTISALEKAHDGEDKGNAIADAMVGAMKQVGGSRGTNKAQLVAMQAMMEQMFGGSVPTLRTILGDSPLRSVSPSDTCLAAGKVMGEVRKGTLVMDGDKLVGIFTPKDMLGRVIAKNLSPSSTAVSEVMTPNPDCVSPDLTVLDALREMHDQKYLHLPVRDDDGTVLGVVDVMELVTSTAGGESGGKGWRDFFHGGMQVDGASDDSSVKSSIKRPEREGKKHNGDDHSEILSNAVSGMDYMGRHIPAEFAFKITDKEGHNHRIKSPVNALDVLLSQISDVLKISADVIVLKYLDDDKDEIVISSDASLKDAVETSVGSGLSAVKLIVSELPRTETRCPSPEIA